MITIELVVNVHKILIKKYGGSDGIRDMNGLEAAVARPYQTFDGVELYETSVDKAAAIIESIVKNHPFIDGNKRTGYVLMRMILLKDKKDIRASEDEKYEFVIKIASSQIDYDKIQGWIQRNLVYLR